ncbi:MAG: hypothetical protein ACE5EB_08320, partial [Thermodesulfobacteriota bacterium]
SYNLTGSVNGLSICSAGLHAALSSGGAIQGSSSLQGTLGIPAQLKGDYAQKVVACGIRPLTTMKDGSVARLVHRK